MRYLWTLGLLSLAWPVWAQDNRVDYDLDDNGLIEINDLADLDAIRNALDGKSLYGSSAGCPEAGCRGFELTASLDFDTNQDGKMDEQDAYWHEGQGWEPIGTKVQWFSAEFDGKGYQIRNLWIHRPDLDQIGLFRGAQKARFSRLVLTGPLLSVTGQSYAGILAGWLENSQLMGVMTTGQVSGQGMGVGGIVGMVRSSVIQASFSSARVSADVRGGGLAGDSYASLIEGSLAVGRSLNGQLMPVGVVGNVSSPQTSLRSSYWALDTSGQTTSADTQNQGLSLTELSCPTHADDNQCVAGKTLYPGWAEFQDASGQAYWQFGPGKQLPGLMLNGRLHRDSDGDGVLDAEDQFPLLDGVAVDSDKDGWPDAWLAQCDSLCQQATGLQLDQLPEHRAAGLDADLDGLPDAWHPGCDSRCQTASGLTLDLHLNDRDNDGVSDVQDTDDDNDGKTDADSNSNGLIEIHNWAELDAIRYQLDGHGQRLTQDGPLNSSGCPVRYRQDQWLVECIGYELVADLDFDTNADGKIDEQDTYWNDNLGWLPIGTETQPFSAVFEGNGHQIRNLVMIHRRYSGSHTGLFGVADHARFSRLVLTGPLLSIRLGSRWTGILAGSITNSEVVAVFTTGQAGGGTYTASLVGQAEKSLIQASFSSSRVEGDLWAAGLVTESLGSLVEGSLVTGRIRSNLRAEQGSGGLIGSDHSMWYSYNPDGSVAKLNTLVRTSLRTSHWALDATAKPRDDSKTGLGALLAELRCPTHADNQGCASGKTLYPGWSEFQDASGQIYWQFGSGNQLPGLMLNGRLYRDSDGDGSLDEDDAFPLIYGASLDADKDGAPDDIWLLCDEDCVRQSGLVPDQFPGKPAASLDADLDGLPDAWNAGCDNACQTASGLTLDLHPNDRDNDGITDLQDTDDNNDGVLDVDSNSNGLIEIHSWVELNAVRYQLDGRAQRLASGSSSSSGCPGRAYEGKWVAQCVGYELVADLDFDTNADGKIDASDQFWNDGQGWWPLGTWYQPFSAVFAGNGHIIRNLMINRTNTNSLGLFGSAHNAQIRELGLAGPLTSIKGGVYLGALAGEVFNTHVQACFVTGGEVMSDADSSYTAVGGLVGSLSWYSTIKASYASTQVSVSNEVATGGLAAELYSASLMANYSASRLIQGQGVSDSIDSKIENSYWAQDVGPLTFGLELGTGVNRSQLQCPVAANDQGCVPGVTLFKDWDQWRDSQSRAYWDFGDHQQLPALRLNGKVYRDTDADGLFDDEDAFPTLPEVALDLDADGAPDSWGARCDLACQQASGLVLDKFPTNRAAFADSDNDGEPDSWAEGCDLVCQQESGLVLDKFPLTTAARVDSDGDGAPDSWAEGCDLACQQASGLVLDKFPTNRAAFADTDNDGAPDSWTSGCDLACQQASGLVLDGFPNDASVSLDANGNGVPDRWNFGCDLSCQQAAGYSLDPQDKVYGFWRHNDGSNYLLQYQAGQLKADYPLVSVGNDWQLQGQGDFNGDGASDLLWRHQTSGELYLFLFDRGQIRQQVRLGQVADPDWKLVAIADVDGDKTSDLIWYHAKTAIGVSWLLKQGALSQELGLPQLTSLGWRLVGSGDLTGDGIEDLVWRHNETGDTWLFEMKQGQMQQALWLFSVPDQDWQLAAVADSNADGKADMIWRHGPSGLVYLVVMDGPQLIQQGSLFELTDLNWQLAATADLNNDGRADLFWRHAVTGQNYLFELNGLTPPEGRFMPEVTDTAWQLGALLKP